MPTEGGGPVCLRHEAFDVYIGREGHGFDPAPWGNPVRLGRTCPVCTHTHWERGSTLSCYEHWLRGRVAVEPAFREAVGGLYGLRLGCFCPPGRPCHGLILAEVAAEIAGPPEDHLLEDVLTFLRDGQRAC